MAARWWGWRCLRSGSGQRPPPLTRHIWREQRRRSHGGARKTSAAAADQARALARFDDFAADFRQRTHRVSGAEQAGHHASRLSTADRNIVRAAASGSAEPEVRRKKIAIPTPATHAAV